MSLFKKLKNDICLSTKRNAVMFPNFHQFNTKKTPRFLPVSKVRRLRALYKKRKPQFPGASKTPLTLFVVLIAW